MAILFVNDLNVEKASLLSDQFKMIFRYYKRVGSNIYTQKNN